MSFANIINAPDNAVTQFERGWISWNRWAGPLFLDESSDMEYSSATKLSISTSSPQLEDDYHSTGSSRIYTQEVIVFTKNLDEDEEVDILH